MDVEHKLVRHVFWFVATETANCEEGFSDVFDNETSSLGGFLGFLIDNLKLGCEFELRVDSNPQTFFIVLLLEHFVSVLVQVGDGHVGKILAV